MKFQQWPKRDPRKNYFLVPNEVFHIGLSHSEISIYCYLLSIEDRKTYQCWPSYKTIGKALGMCENTVSKYVRSMEEKGLIRTEPTMIRSKDGRPLNGNLLYTIRPIQAAMESFYERQFRQLEEIPPSEASARLAESAHRSPQNALCAPGERVWGEYPRRGGRFGPLSGRFRAPPNRFREWRKMRDEGESRINPGAARRLGVTPARSAGSSGVRKLASLWAERAVGVSFPTKPRVAGFCRCLFG
ncbi:MAG: helix-turn-helix domain-containing protein [Hydrogeniiclostridium mannosilyticum]